MNKFNKCVSFFIMLFLNSTYLFADIGSRGRLDSNGTSDLEIVLMGIVAIILGGLGSYCFLADGLKNGFKNKESNKWGCVSIILAVVGLLGLVLMCSH